MYQHCSIPIATPEVHRPLEEVWIVRVTADLSSPSTDAYPLPKKLEESAPPSSSVLESSDVTHVEAARKIMSDCTEPNIELFRNQINVFSL